MPYNEKIDERIKKIVSSWKNTEAIEMFGGIGHLLNGNMFSGVYKDYLILRLGEENAEKAFELPFVKPFDITGKSMKDWVIVESEGFADDEELGGLLDKAKEFVLTLPSK